MTKVVHLRLQMQWWKVADEVGKDFDIILGPIKLKATEYIEVSTTAAATALFSGEARPTVFATDETLLNQDNWQLRDLAFNFVRTGRTIVIAPVSCSATYIEEFAVKLGLPWTSSVHERRAITVNPAFRHFDVSNIVGEYRPKGLFLDNVPNEDSLLISPKNAFADPAPADYGSYLGWQQRKIASAKLEGKYVAAAFATVGQGGFGTSSHVRKNSFAPFADLVQTFGLPYVPLAVIGLCTIVSTLLFTGIPSSIMNSNPLGGVKYEALGAPKLRTFIRERQRLVVNPPPLPGLKAACIDKLRQMDKDWRFNFLQLPRELRDQVYEELMIFPTAQLPEREPRGTNCSGILTASRQLSNEAEEILYKHNTVCVYFRSQQPRPRRPGPRRREDGIDISMGILAGPRDRSDRSWKQRNATLDELAKLLPPGTFRKAHQLQINIELDCAIALDGTVRKSRFNVLNRMLYLMATAVSVTSRLRGLIINLSDSTTLPNGAVTAPATSFQDGESLNTLLWPLPKIAAAYSRPNVVFHGLPAAVLGSLQQQIAVATPVRSQAVEEMVTFLARAKEVRNLLRARGTGSSTRLGLLVMSFAWHATLMTSRGIIEEGRDQMIDEGLVTLRAAYDEAAEEIDSLRAVVAGSNVS